MPKNTKQVSLRYKTKQEILKARKERDEAILKLEKLLAEAKVKEKEIIQLSKIEDQKFKEKEKKDKIAFKNESIEQNELLKLNKEDLKAEQKKYREELRIRKEEILSKKRLSDNDKKHELALIKDKLREEKIEAQRKIAEQKQKEAERKFEIQKQIEEQRVKVAEAKIQSDAIIADKKRELAEQKEQVRIRRLEARALLQANKAQRLEAIRLEKIRVKELEAEEKRKFIERQLELKGNNLNIQLANQEEVVELTRESNKKVKKAHVELSEQVIETHQEALTTAIPVAERREVEERHSFSYEEKVFDFEQDEPTQEYTLQAEAQLVTAFGKKIFKLYQATQKDSTTNDNKKVMKKDATIYEGVTEFEKVTEAETPISIESILAAANAVLGKLSAEEEKEMGWWFAATLLRDKVIKFGEGYIIPERISGLRTASFTPEGTVSEYAQFLDGELEELMNEVIAYKLNNGAAIQISKNLIVVKHEDQIKVLANTPYLLA